jgi:hypothetical protein
MCPRIKGTEPEIIRDKPMSFSVIFGLNRMGDGSSHARTKPVTHKGMPRRFLKIIVAHWPPFSPHRLEYAEVKALAPTNANPIIVRNIAIPMPVMPRYTTDIYATVKANKRYIAVYMIVFIPPLLSST